MNGDIQAREARAVAHAIKETGNPLRREWSGCAEYESHLKGAEEERAAMQKQLDYAGTCAASAEARLHLTYDERDALAEKVEKYQNHIAELGQLSLDREEEVRVLREALERHGVHDMACLEYSAHDGKPCICGLDEALREAGEEAK